LDNARLYTSLQYELAERKRMEKVLATQAAEAAVTAERSRLARDLHDAVHRALAAGVTAEQVIVDPGIGFGKTVDQNLELIDRTHVIRSLGFPVLVGPSRKSFIGLTLALPPEERLEGTAAAVSVAVARGADIVRVHDVAHMSRVVRMCDAIVRRENDP
jgi:dihydropteroate synthase